MVGKGRSYAVISLWLIQELGSRLDLNIVETLQYSYKLSCNQLLDMHHTQN